MKIIAINKSWENIENKNQKVKNKNLNKKKYKQKFQVCENKI